MQTRRLSNPNSHIILNAKWKGAVDGMTAAGFPSPCVYTLQPV